VTSTQLDQLLDRLAKDDAFREKALGDPVAAFAEHGFRVDPSEVPTVRRLPSKQALATERERIKGAFSPDHVCLIFFAQTG
jgi:putative modified peptide